MSTRRAILLWLNRMSLADWVMTLSWFFGDLGTSTQAASETEWQGATSKPSIVLILADDLGYGDLGGSGVYALAVPVVALVGTARFSLGSSVPLSRRAVARAARAREWHQPWDNVCAGLPGGATGEPASERTGGSA
jgi:hypothetical protein